MGAENEKTAHHLNEVRQFAKDKIASGQEPPWAWYQYMKLLETIDAISGGMDCTATMENLPQSAMQSDRRLQLVDSTYPQDVSQHHPSNVPVHLPM